MDKNKREFKQMLKGEGLKLISLTRTGKHYKATIEAPNKRRMIYTLANSASDYRAGKNAKQDIARFFNN